MAEATPFLHRTAERYANILRYPEKDVFQILNEAALRVEARFDPSKGAKFETYLWLPITGAVIDFVEKDHRDLRHLVPLLNAIADAGPMAMLKDDDTPFDLFAATDEEISKQFSDTIVQLAGSAYLAVLETAPSPEQQLLEAEERAWMVEKTREVMADFSESDRALLEKVGIEGMSVAAALAATPPWDERPVARGRRYYLRLERRLAEEFGEFEFGQG